MIRYRCFVCVALMLIALSQAAWSGWLNERFAHEADPLPFSFSYGGKTFAGGFPATWKIERVWREPEAQQLKQTITWSDSETGLELACARKEAAF